MLINSRYMTGITCKFLQHLKCSQIVTHSALQMRHRKFQPLEQLLAKFSFLKRYIFKFHKCLKYLFVCVIERQNMTLYMSYLTKSIECFHPLLPSTIWTILCHNCRLDLKDIVAWPLIPGPAILWTVWVDASFISSCSHLTYSWPVRRITSVKGTSWQKISQ